MPPVSRPGAIVKVVPPVSQTRAENRNGATPEENGATPLFEEGEAALLWGSFSQADCRGGRWSVLTARLFGSGIPCLADSFKTGLTSERTLCAVRPGWLSLERSWGNPPAIVQWAASTQSELVPPDSRTRADSKPGPPVS